MKAALMWLMLHCVRIANTANGSGTAANLSDAVLNHH